MMFFVISSDLQAKIGVKPWPCTENLNYKQKIEKYFSFKIDYFSFYEIIMDIFYYTLYSLSSQVSSSEHIPPPTVLAGVMVLY